MEQDLCVLVVDDNPVGRAQLAGLLRKVRHWRVLCTLCATGDEALEHIDQCPPQVVFVDYNLRGEKGSQVIPRLKEAGCLAGFVLFTGMNGEEAILEALRAGADDYLHKADLSLTSVSRALHHAVERAKIAQALQNLMDDLHQANEALEDRVRVRTLELQETQEKLDLITSSAHDSIILLDQEARVIFWNPAAEKVFGYPFHEIVGKAVFHLLPSSDFKSRWRTHYPVFPADDSTATPGSVYEFAAVRKNGEVFPVSASVSAIQRPEGWHTVLIPRDITHRQAIELSLRQATEEAQRATHLKDQFVSLVAHDLRGPMTTILGFLDLLQSDKKNPLNKKQKGFIRWIAESGQKMVRIIDELLNLSRLKAGRIVPNAQFFNARFFVASLLETVQPMADKKGVVLDNAIEERCRLYADPYLFGEVVSNLLTNAIKFCQKDDCVVLSCIADRPATLVVQDSGVGISKKHQAKLFSLDERRSTPGTVGEHGTGFGLPLSMELMKAHGGTLSVVSKEGQGSTFFAQLPDVMPQVLLVDDDDLFRLRVVQKLRRDRVEVVEARDAREGLRLLGTQTFHLVIADIQMPGMDGMELLKELRSRPEGKAIPVIVVTADETIATRELAFQLGADDFITKPLDSADFIPRVGRFLK